MSVRARVFVCVCVCVCVCVYFSGTHTCARAKQCYVEEIQRPFNGLFSLTVIQNRHSWVSIIFHAYSIQSLKGKNTGELSGVRFHSNCVNIDFCRVIFHLVKWDFQELHAASLVHLVSLWSMLQSRFLIESGIKVELPSFVLTGPKQGCL